MSIFRESGPPGRPAAASSTKLTNMQLRSLLPAAWPALLLTAAGFLFTSLVQAQKPVVKSVYFDTDQADLKPEARQTLEGVLNQLAQMPDFDITIEAYTDDKGSAEYNKSLAERRAASVNNFLSENGCKPRTITITPVGISNQQRGKSTAESRRLNRRVDVTIVPDPIEDFKELSEKTSVPHRNEFTLLPDRQTVFTSAGGVTVTVPVNSFVLANGKAPGTPVTVQFTDALQPVDWIFNNLSTHTSAGEILQTAGMYHIEAVAGGQKLRLREGASLSVSIPAATYDPEMEIFYGVRDSKSGAVAWEPAAARQEEVQRFNFGTDNLSWRRYRLLDSLKKNFTRVKHLACSKPSVPVFSDKRLRGSFRRPPRAPLMRAPLEPEQPVARAPLADNPESVKTLEQKDREALKLYRRKMKRYRERLADYRSRWLKYRTDSTTYAKACLYREDCRKRLDQYENALHTYLLKQVFNDRVQGFSVYYSSASHSGNLDDLHESAYRSMLCSDYLYLRNKLRRQLRQPVIPRNCRYQDDCNDPEKKGWLEKGKNLLNTLCESSGYNRVYAGIKEQYDQLLEESRQKATDNVQNLASYSFEVNQLGWINVDKFYKYPEAERAPVIVAESSEDTRVFLVFKEFRGALALSYRDGRFFSPPLPRGTPVTVVALKLKEGSPQLFLLDTKVGESGNIPKATYEALTLRQLQDKMAQLNS